MMTCYYHPGTSIGIVFGSAHETADFVGAMKAIIDSQTISDSLPGISSYTVRGDNSYGALTFENGSKIYTLSIAGDVQNLRGHVLNKILYSNLPRAIVNRLIELVTPESGLDQERLDCVCQEFDIIQSCTSDDDDELIEFLNGFRIIDS